MIYSFQIMLRHFFGFLAPPWVSCAQNFEATCQRFQSPFLSSESQSKQVQKRAIPPRDVDLHIRCISDSWRLEERKRSGVALSYKLKEHLLMVTRQKSSDYSLEFNYKVNFLRTKLCAVTAVYSGATVLYTSSLQEWIEWHRKGILVNLTAELKMSLTKFYQFLVSKSSKTN